MLTQYILDRTLPVFKEESRARAFGVSERKNCNAE